MEKKGPKNRKKMCVWDASADWDERFDIISQFVIGKLSCNLGNFVNSVQYHPSFIFFRGIALFAAERRSVERLRIVKYALWSALFHTRGQCANAQSFVAD